MHVGLNLVYLVPGATGGTETYARELIPALLEAAGESTRFTAFLSREAASARGEPWCEAIPSVTVPVNARRRPELVLGEQALLPRLARRERVDVLHSLATTAPGWGAFRRVTTVQDVIYAIYPETHVGLRAHALRLLVPLAVRAAHRIIATSEQTRRDLVERLHAEPGKIDLVPLGVGTRRVAPLPERKLRERLALDEGPLVLAVSAKRPHKNLGRLLEALSLLEPERRPQLVLPGYPTPHEDELRRTAQRLGIAGRVRFPGWVAPEELEALYAAASLVVVPSLYEGFGLPVLEAMSRGVPVACSNRGALAEVAGQAALLFDPEDPRSIAQAIEQLLGEPATAAKLRDAGLERAREFTWERTARGTLESYARALGRDPRQSGA